MTLVKLAYKNVRTQFRDYFVYFVSMSFSIMVYFTFISMSFNETLQKIAEKNVKIDVVLQASSLLILFFVVLFMFYSNAFFIKKRKKEIGLYNVLGMRKWQIAQLFFLENLFLGAWALVIGIILGSLLSKLFAMILLAIMHVAVQFPFTLSLPTVGQTVLVFLIIFVIVAIQNASLVYRYKIVDLFKANNNGERLPKVTIWTGILGVFGLTLIGIGYAIALNFVELVSSLENEQSGYLLLGLVVAIFVSVIVGTYLFFNSFLVLLIRIAQKQKIFYYRGMNLVTVGNLLFRLKRNATTLATIAVLSATTLCAVGGAAVIYSFAENQINYESTFDLHYESSNQEVSRKIKETMKKYPEFPIESAVSAKYKVILVKDGAVYKSYSDHEKAHVYSIISESDYNKVIVASGIGSKIQLKNTKSTYLISQFYLTSVLGSPENKKITVEDGNLKLTIQGIRRSFAFGSRAANGEVLVVSDQVFKEVQHPIVTFTRTGLQIKDYENSQKLNEELTDKLSSDSNIVFIENPAGETYFASRDLANFRLPVEQSTYLTMGTVIYIAVFLGLVFMFATGSIIMLKQLAEAEEEIDHYHILKKIGVSPEEIRSSIYKQTAFVFILPMLIGSIHTIVAIRSISFFLLSPNATLGYIACGSFILIYFIFYLFTARAYNKIINGRIT